MQISIHSPNMVVLSEERPMVIAYIAAVIAYVVSAGVPLRNQYSKNKGSKGRSIWSIIHVKKLHHSSDRVGNLFAKLNTSVVLEVLQKELIV
jgi:hypothetical protein